MKQLTLWILEQVYAQALLAAAERETDDPELVLELGRKIAAAHTGLTAGAADTLAAIVTRTLPVALQVLLCPSTLFMLTLNAH